MKEAGPTVVRRCARCDAPSAVVVRDWGTRLFFGLVDGKRTSRLDPGNLGLAVVLGLFTLGAWALLGFGVLAKLRHPVVRVSP